MNPKVTVVNDTEYHHLPDHQKPVNLYGLTLRQALKKLREVDFGNIGGTHNINLSDGTVIDVVLNECIDGTLLMSSQYIHRWYEDSGKQVTVRKYVIY